MASTTHGDYFCVEFEGGCTDVHRDLPVLIWYGDPNLGLSDLEGFTQAILLWESAIDLHKGRKVWLYQSTTDSWVRILRIC